jgi:uncharacterized protein DUF6958
MRLSASLYGERWKVCIKQITIQPSRTASPMAEEKILTKHPWGKSGKNISKPKYNALKSAILSALKNKELTHTELFNHLNNSLKNKFSGNVSWYGETVKLDLEARKILERTSSKPQKYRVKRN